MKFLKIILVMSLVLAAGVNAYGPDDLDPDIRPISQQGKDQLDEALAPVFQWVHERFENGRARFGRIKSQITGQLPTIDTKTDDIIVTQAPTSIDQVEPKAVTKIISVEQISTFVGSHKYELAGVAGIVMIGGVLYVLYQNDGLELLLDFVLDHPKLAAGIVVGVTTVTVLGAVAYYKGYSISDVKDISLPEISLPKISLPKVSLPEMKLPQLPSVSLPSFKRA